MPCVGTNNRTFLYSDIMQEIQQLIDDYSDYNCLIGGDFNVDLDNISNISLMVNSFIGNNTLSRGDIMYPTSDKFTYQNESLNVASCIDYILTSNISRTVAFNVVDLDVNFSDHRPILAVCHSQNVHIPGGGVQPPASGVKNFRWDHAPLHLYYEQTRLLFEPLLAELIVCENSFACMSHDVVKVVLERMCNTLVKILGDCSAAIIPRYIKDI